MFFASPWSLREAWLWAVDPYNACLESLQKANQRKQLKYTFYKLIPDKDYLHLYVQMSLQDKSHLAYTITPFQILGYHSSTQAITVDNQYIVRAELWKHKDKEKEPIYLFISNFPVTESTYRVSFANSMASSSVENALTHKTGPKTSSLQICIDVAMSVMTVGSTKNPFFRCCQSFKDWLSIMNYWERPECQQWQVVDNTSGRAPPHKMVAPSLLAFEMNFKTFSYCSRLSIY